MAEEQMEVHEELTDEPATVSKSKAKSRKFSK